ncbi:hypothetical protein BJ165DRAFT_1521619 [Panaeolus papilionaceus]|nr:hypothetical protein BJ165DRAFT_1521619 [Panaeolus papilionaceus]
MLRTGSRRQAIPILLLWAGYGNAQTFSQTLQSAATAAVAAPTDPLSGALTNTISTLAESSSPSSTTSISLANSTSSLTTSTISSPITTSIDDPTAHLHSLAPIIAGSLAAFMVLLASVLVAVVASRRKKRRRRTHSLNTRFSANVHDRSTPSRRPSGRHNLMRQPIDSPTASIDLSSRPSKKLRPLARFDDDVEAGRHHEAPRIVVTEDNQHTRTRHSHQQSGSSISAASTPSLTTSSPATLSTGGSGDVKHPNIFTDQTPALRSAATITDSRSRSVSPSRDPSPRTQSAAGLTTRDTHPQRLTSPSNNTSRPSSAISSHTTPHSTPSDSLSSPSTQSSALLAPTLRRDNLIALLQQQQEILLLSGSRDSRTVGAVALLQEQIDMLRRHQQQEEAILGLGASEAPPAYEDSVRS